jgi:RNA polymerase-binding transcription factor DksA
MASARKKAPASKAPKKSKPAPGKAQKKSRPAAKPVRKPAPAKAKQAAKKPVPAKAKPAAKKPVPAKAKPAAKKPVPKKLAAAKRPLSVGAAKAAALKAARLAMSAKGAAPKGAKAAPPAPKVKAKPPRLVPVTAEARAAAALAARASKPGVKGRSANRPEPEVRPLGVLPLSSQVKARDVAPRRPAPPPRPLTPPKGSPKPQPVRKGDDRLTDDDLKHFEQRLLTERRRIMAEMGHLEATVLKVNPRDAEGEQSGYSYHMADAGTDSMEREKAFDIASKEVRLLLEIDEALRRLYNGTYGLCEVSGQPISRTRLEALPWARLSIDEQEKLERERRLGRMVAPEKE